MVHLQNSNLPSSMPKNSLTLAKHEVILFHQKRELTELMGIETRNKYEILDANKSIIGFAAEQQKGLFGFLARQFFGHWRKFDIYFYNNDRNIVIHAHHPFRFLFQRLEIFDGNGKPLGAIQQRFSILTKKFDVINHLGLSVLEISSPIWKPWTFPFLQNGRQVAMVKKKMSGIFNEIFTDKDNFILEYTDANLREDLRCLVLAGCLFIDLQYFERKANR